MKNKVAEMVAIMIHSSEAQDFFKEGWLAIYNDIMDNPIKAVSFGEEGGFFNKVCGMALLDWYESKEGK